MNSIEIKSFLDLKFVNNPTFSPDGKHIAFTVANSNIEKNGYDSYLYLYRVENKQVVKLTSNGDEKAYAWCDNDTLLFISNRKKDVKGSDFYKISPFGGEATFAFSFPHKVSAFQCLGEDKYLMQAVDYAEEYQADDGYEIIQELPFWFNGKGFTNRKRTGLYIYNGQDSSVEQISDVWSEVDKFAVRENKILYKGYPWKDVRGNRPGLYLYDISSKETKCLLETEVVLIRDFCLESETTALVAISKDSEFMENVYPSFYRMNLADASYELLSYYEFSVGVGSVNSDAKYGTGCESKFYNGLYYFVTTINDSAYLRTISKDGKISENLTRDGACLGFDLCNENLVTCCMYDSNLAELYLNGEKITSFNDQWSLEHSISHPEFMEFTATDGFNIHGWVMKPTGYTAGKSYPAILNIHGGPRTVFGSVFHHEMQMWANAGYFVFFCNPRGSDGKGNEFGDINGKYGTVDYDNIMEFTDKVLEKYTNIDINRVGVTGGSYGGFMTNWIIGHTNRFAVAASQRSIASWISFEHISDIGHTFTRSNQATITREDEAKLWWHSPLQYAPNCKTPTLFIHSEHDFRCHMVEGISMFTALKMHGCETRMCLFKEETHDLSRSGRPRNRIKRMEEILQWMDLYLKKGE